MNRHTRRTIWLSTLAAAALLAACDKSDPRSAGQKLDETVASAQQAATEVRASTDAAVKDMKAAASQAAGEVGATARDLAITTQVNAALARDGRLSALRINVDTQDGRVVLEGTAPDAGARDHATALATGVEGVKAVDNRLDLKR